MDISKTITRRDALLGGAASSVGLAVPAFAAVAAIKQKPEHPNEKVRRLAREIATTLNDPDFHGFRQVTVTPSWISMQDAEEDLPEASLNGMAQAIDRHRTAWDAFDASCPYADSMDARYSVAGERRNVRLGNIETKALNALVALVPCTLPEFRMRAAYLLEAARKGRFVPGDDQFQALLASSAAAI